MPTYNNLPGTYVSRLDGGLRVSQSDEAPVILLLGTADKGVGDELFDARDTAAARQQFGGSSELYQGLVEARRGYGEGANIRLFRIGTSPAQLLISGANAEKVKVIPRDRIATINSEYRVSFDASDNKNYLWVYNENGSLVYSNAPANRVDVGVIEIRGDLADISGAQSFGDPSAGSYADSVPMGSGTLTSGAVFTDATIGFDADNLRARYEALDDAYRLLDAENFDIVAPLGVHADDPNVAFFVSGTGGREYPREPWQSRDNPQVWGSGTLGWFKKTAPTRSSTTGEWTYQWADDIVLSGVGSDPTMHANGWETPDERIADGYHEVSFAYQLANFCYQHTKNQSTCIGMIGFRAPVSYYQGDLHNWAGERPVKDAAGTITTDGFGLAGFYETAGASATVLNALCHDKSTGRSPGFFATDSEYKDGSAKVDSGGYPIDIGAYISLVGDSPLHLNSIIGTVGYTESAAAYYAGLVAQLDEKTAPTNQLAQGIRVPYKLGKRRLDDLVASKMTMMVQRRDGAYVVDAPTAATDASDYRRLSTVRIVSLVERKVRKVGEQFIGQVASDAIKEGFRSQLEESLQDLQIRGYLKSYRFTVDATRVEEILGKLNVKLVLVVPHEIRQIFYTVSLAIE